MAARKGSKRAVIAIGHSILRTVFHILSGKEPYRELGADHVNLRDEAKRKSYLKKELEKLGYDVSITQTQIQTG